MRGGARPGRSTVITGTLLSLAVAAAAAPAHAQDTPAPASAPAPQATLEGRRLRVTSGSSTVVMDLPCEGRAALREAASVFVACGAEGVVRIDISDPLAPRPSGRMAVDGEVIGLFLRDGDVWAEIAHVDARPVHIDTQSLTVTRPILPAPSVATPQPSAPPQEPKRSLMAPPRRSNLWELSLTMSAFLALGQIGGGELGWASAVYRFDLPLVVRAEVAPFGIGLGPSSPASFTQFAGSRSTAGTVVSLAGYLLAGVDTQFVEVALGGGVATLNNSSSSTKTPKGVGPAIVEEARFGTRDGLALNLESTTVAANNSFAFGSFVGSVQVPMTKQVMLVFRAGGGDVGFGFGDLGGRVIVRGDGGPDTIALTGFLGGAVLTLNQCGPLQSSTFGPTFAESCNYASLGGPSVGGGVEWRR